MATMIRQESMGLEVRQVLEMHLAWLNGWHEAQGDRLAGGELVRMKIEDYWELGDDDAPTLCLDTLSTVHDEFWDGGGAWYGRRLMVIECTPYHDEGGQAVLTAWFTKWDEDSEWTLKGLVQEFDTYHDLLASDGKLVRKWEEN